MPLEDCHSIVILHLCHDTPDFAAELLTGQLRSCRKNAFRRRVALQELMMQVRAKQGRYAEAMALAREAFDTPGIPWTVSRMDRYEMLCSEIRVPDGRPHLRELALRIFTLDPKLFRNHESFFPLLCARAWLRFPNQIKAVVSEMFTAYVDRVGFPPDEIWSEPGLRAQIFKARSLRRAAGGRYSKLYLSLWEMHPSQRPDAIKEYTSQECVGVYRQLAKELLKPTDPRSA